MAIIRILFFFFITVKMASAGIRDPFPSGYFMGNLGTILWDDGLSGRQPWISSVFCGDTAGFGFAAGAVSYYDRMDNMEDRGIYGATGGVGVYTRYIKIKIAVSQLTAFGIYFEQSGYLSIGAELFNSIRAGIDLSGHRSGLQNFNVDERTIGEAGFSGWVPFRLASLALSIEHIILKESRINGTDPLLLIRCGIHTVRNRFGAQGVVVEITPSYAEPVRIIIGEEYRFLRWLGIHAAVGNNPVMIAVGLVVEWKRAGAEVAMVNHPELGWSRGFSAYYKRD